MKRILSVLLVLTLLVTALPLTALAGGGTDTNAFILPSGLHEVKAGAFAGNTLLSTLVVPNTVTSIGSEAFKNCTGLSEVSIASREITIADDAFDGCPSDTVFYAHSDSKAFVWALAHGYRCESLDDGSEHLARFSELVSHSGFDPSMLMSGTYASKCLIVRTQDGKLPDISSYSPIDIFKSDANLYYVQFNTEGETEDCYIALDAMGYQVEVDMIGETSDIVSAEGVTISEPWLSDDVMGFDVYAPFVADHYNGAKLTVAVIDSGVNASAWGKSPISENAASFVGGSALSDSIRHGSKVASIIHDCLGANASHVTLLPIKVVNSGSMYRTSVIIESIKHAVKNGADIINLSLGWDVSEGVSDEIVRQINNAKAQGTLIVAAAGNGNGEVMFPARVSGVIAVSALVYSSANGYSVRSRTGSQITYTAPGSYLKTTAYPRVDLEGDKKGTASTSFAAPQITAALALVKMDANQNGHSAASVLDSVCRTFADEGLSSASYNHGMPEVDKLAVIHTIDVTLKNMDETQPIPSRLWLANKGNDFMLTWELVPSNTTDKTVTVTTSDENVVSVRQYGNSSALISAVGLGQATISVTNDGITKQIELVVEQPVTQIGIAGFGGNPMIVGDSAQLTAVISPTSPAPTNPQVVWSSSNDQVVEIDPQTGFITAMAEGTAVITCAATDGYVNGNNGIVKAELEIEVIDTPDAQSVKLYVGGQEVSQITMEKGTSVNLDYQVLPERALQEVYFNVPPNNAITVSENGVITAVAAGTATIMVTATTGRNVVAYLGVTVIVSPIDIDVTIEKQTLDIGETTFVSAVLSPSDVTETTVTWASDNTGVATVNSAGLVTAIAPGTAHITGTTVNGLTDSVTVTVRQPITLTLNANGGTCDTSSVSAFSGYPVGTLPAAAREYWTFKGWYTASVGGTLVGTDTSFTADTTLYAHWEGLPYTVTFNKDGTVIETRTGKVGEKLGALPSPTKDNYTFRGWFTALEGGTEVTQDYIQYTTADLTVYAVWTNNPYTVYFHSNYGSDSVTTKTGVVDVQLGDLPALERAYYTLGGWFTASTGGTEVTSAYVQSTTDDLHLYAHWTPLPYTVTFDANGGSVSPNTKTAYVDTLIGELPVPTRAYYTFSGWYIEGDSPVHVTASYQQDTDANITATARWTPLPYTVTFDANGGSVSPTTMTAYVDTPIGELPDPEREYYSFVGWYRSSERIDNTYIQSNTEQLNLKAHWNAKQYTVTVYRNFNQDDYHISAKLYGKVGEMLIHLASVPELCTREHYKFNGISTARSGGTSIDPTYIQYTDEPLTLYIQWEPLPYTMTFDANGGNCSETSRTCYVDTAIGTLPQPNREYYTFLGWYTALENGTEVTASYLQNSENNITVYAIWEPMVYTMMFNANGGTTPVSLINTFRVDTPIGTMPEPTRQYYTFDGWYTAAEGGTKITPTYTHPTTNTITVYAHWIPHTYRLMLDANGGVCDPYLITANVDQTYSLPTPYRDCYRFEYWYIDNGDGSIGADEMFPAEYVQHNVDNTTLHAMWTSYADMVTVPTGTINEDTAFFCRGTVTLPKQITSVTGGVYQDGVCVTNGGAEYSYIPASATNSFRMEDTEFYTKLDLYSLEPGDYTFKVTVHCEGGLNQVIVDSSFTIVEYTGATAFKITGLKYWDVMKKETIGGGLHTYGVVSSDVNITSIAGRVLNSSGTVKTSKTVSPNATSYNLYNSAYDTGMKFDQCSATGWYRYIINVTDASGRQLQINLTCQTKSGETHTKTIDVKYELPTLVGQCYSSDKIYLFYHAYMPWDSARNFAQGLGGDLACVTSAEENSVIYSGMPQNGATGRYYLMGSYKSGSSWLWSSGESMSYTNFSANEPSGSFGVEIYLGMKYDDGCWNDMAWGDVNTEGFIVEIPRS